MSSSSFDKLRKRVSKLLHRDRRHTSEPTSTSANAKTVSTSQPAPTSTPQQPSSAQPRPAATIASSTSAVQDGPSHPLGVPIPTNTVDTTVEQHMNAPVVHETTHVQTERIVQEQIYNEIHQHHVVKVIQPLVDVEVLPTRHFVPNPDGTLAEISAAEADKLDKAVEAAKAVV